MNKKNILTIALLTLVTSSVAFGAGDYTAVIAQNKEGVQSAGKLGASWLALIIAWSPVVATLVAIFASWKYNHKKAKQEQEEGSLKAIAISLVAIFVAIVLITSIMTLVTKFLAGDAGLAVNIMQDYWKTYLTEGLI